jgi:competence ComEA-like helix-hairpin-helix protein
VSEGARIRRPPPFAPATITFLSATVLLGSALVLIQQAGRAGPPAARVEHHLDLNSASADELAAIPGVGPALAGRIVRDRSENGLYDSIDDLDRVKGIGEATIDLIAPWVVVSRPPKRAP